MASESSDVTNAPYPVCSDISKVTSLLKEYGVCVIPNVFSNAECDSWMEEILSNIETISGHQVNRNEPESWTVDKLPPQVRYGLYQSTVQNLRPVWEIRRDPRMKNIFKPVYSGLRGMEIDEFVCSIDGINIQPNISRNIEGERDWAHTDQTERDDSFKCVQGQVVLTNSAASFRASPTSHKYFKEIMEVAGIEDNNSNFAKFSDDQLAKIKKDVLVPNNVPFQLPIRAEKGSVILWFSTTIHSSMSSGTKETTTPDDAFKGWRGVSYVCYRPKSDFSMDQLKVLEDCIENNLGTNHWSTKVLKPNARNQVISPTIDRLLKNPQLVYEVTKFKPDKASCLVK
jgi:hypothetical protein